MTTVFVFGLFQFVWAALTEYQRLGAYKQQILISHGPGGWKSQTKVLADLMSCENRFLFIDDHLLAVLMWQQKGSGGSLGSLMGTSSPSNHLSKAPPHLLIPSL